MPLAERVKDLPRGRKRATWKAELREALLDGSKSVERVSAKDIVGTVAAVRRRRGKGEPTVVAEAVEATITTTEWYDNQKLEDLQAAAAKLESGKAVEPEALA